MVWQLMVRIIQEWIWNEINRSGTLLTMPPRMVFNEIKLKLIVDVRVFNATICLKKCLDTIQVPGDRLYIHHKAHKAKPWRMQPLKKKPRMRDTIMFFHVIFVESHGKVLVCQYFFLLVPCVGNESTRLNFRCSWVRDGTSSWLASYILLKVAHI
jgi:hypothetical protein